MKIHAMFKLLTLLAATVCSVDAFAYSDDKDKEICRNPKVQEFTLPEYSGTEKKEAAAEAEFSFVVSGWSDPKKIKLFTKDQAIPFTVESNSTFHRVKSKLPAALTGKVTRINVRIPAVLGCYTTMGWLVKVADNAKATETVAPNSTNPDTSKTQDGDAIASPSNSPKPAETVAPAGTADVAPSPQTEATPPANATQAPKKENIQDVQN